MPRTTAGSRVALRDHGNYSLKFDGTNDWVDFGTTDFAFERTQAFSVSMWGYMGSTTSNRVLFGRAAGSPGFQGWWLRYESTNRSFNVFLASNFAVSNHVWKRAANTAEVNKWVRLQISYDGSSTAAGILIYINGVLATMTTVNDALSASIVAAGINARMGTITDDTQDFSGNLTDVAVYSDVLTAQEMSDIHFNGIYPSDNLYARYKFTDASGSTLTDSSGNARNGTITAALWDSTIAPLQLSRKISNPSYARSWQFTSNSSIAVTGSAVDFSSKKNVIDFWYNMSATGGAAEIITNNTTATSSPSLTFKALRGNTLRNIALQWNDAGGSQLWTSGNMDLNTWNHIVLVLDTTSGAKVCKVYINGSLNGSLTTNTATGGTALTSAVLTLDKSSGGTGAGLFAGNIKDLRFMSFTGTWADADATLLCQGLVPSTCTLLNRWIGEDVNNATAVDSVASNTITLTNVATSGLVPSKNRRIINPTYTKDWVLNGTSAYFKTNSTFDLSAVNKIVADFWFQPSSSTGAQTLMELSSNYGAAADRFLVSQIGTSALLTARMVTTAGEANWNATVRPIPGQWIHVMAVFDRSLAMSLASRLFVDGGMIGSSVLATGTLSGNFANQTLNIGSTNGTTSFTNGNIKDVRIHSFTGTFTSDDAVKFYQGLTPSGYTPIARWIGEDSSTTATDSVGSNTATLTNVTYGTDMPSKARTAVS